MKCIKIKTLVFAALLMTVGQAMYCIGELRRKDDLKVTILLGILTTTLLLF